MKKSRQRSSINFHREIYKEAAVKEAARAYSAFASFSFLSEGKYIKVVIDLKSGTLPEHVAEEFANMALFNSI